MPSPSLHPPAARRRHRRLLVHCAALILAVSALVDRPPHAAPEASASGAARPPASDPEARALLRAILDRYGAYTSFEVRFAQKPISRGAGEGEEETGIVRFRRPGSWRWDYLAPERKVVVVRGGIVTVLVAGDLEPTRYDLGGKDAGAGVGALLEGGDAVARTFAARFDPSSTKEEAVLVLDPLEISEEYERVFVRVRRKSLEISEILAQDPGGNALQFRFSDLRANLPLEDALFVPPSSVTPHAP